MSYSMKLVFRILCILIISFSVSKAQNIKYNPVINHTLVSSLPAQKPVSCESEWMIRYLHYHPAAVVPRRMYFASCQTNTDRPRFFTSFSIGKNAKHPKNDPSSGALLEARYNPDTQKLEQVGKIRHFPECVWAEGVAASHDCNTVSVLCRRRYKDKDYDTNALATHSAHKWMTQPRCAKLSMFMYEFKNGDIHSRPKKTLLHKAVDYTWENGSSYLRMGHFDNTYGIGLKSRVVDPKGQCHEADAFLVMKQDSHKMTRRGYSWACGTGHTTFNHPVYNPYTRKYAVMCSTDYSAKRKSDKFTGFWLRLEDRKSIEFGHTNNKNIHTKGGTGSLLALRDGGFLGIVVGVKGHLQPKSKLPRKPPTSIGIVRFNKNGRTKGIKWIISKKNTYLSYPQLARLDDNRFLVGFGEMKRLKDKNDKNDESYRTPWVYYLQEIDIDGRALSQVNILKKYGWGELDQLISLGNGKIAWSYIPNPTLLPGGKIPSCNASSLQMSVYHTRAKVTNENPQIDKYPYTFSNYYGNENESKHNEVCSNGKLTGLQWYSGAIIDRVSGLCSDQKQTRDLGAQSGRGPKQFQCPGVNNYIQKLHVWPFGLAGSIERLQITCHNGETSEIFGGWDKNTTEKTPALGCPGNIPPIGIRGNKGAYLNGIGLICKK